MNPCEDMHDKIIFYDDLSPGEQQAVRQHIDSCADCRKYLEEVQALTLGLQQNISANHIDDKLLRRYGIYLADPDEPDYDGRQLTRQEIASIESHVKTCRACGQKVEQVVALQGERAGAAQRILTELEK
jgi:anti-sigma factor RsiW